jgi:cephalosporin hydroxylase
MNDHFQFKETCNREISRQGADPTLTNLSHDWMAKAAEFRYSQHFEWLGRPVFRHPQDLMALQQLVWEVQPDLIVETGVARGGSLVFAASMLELLARCGGNPGGMVLGIDSDIREHNRAAILAHPMAGRIRMFQGSSISRTVADEVQAYARNFSRVMVCLDSHLTDAHLLQELKLYAALVSRGSYCVVFSAATANASGQASSGKRSSNAASPGSAAFEFLRSLESHPSKGIDGEPLVYQIDTHAADRLLITGAPGGFLQRI